MATATDHTRQTRKGGDPPRPATPEPQASVPQPQESVGADQTEGDTRLKSWAPPPIPSWVSRQVPWSGGPSWYQNPDGSATDRWWDGAEWSSRVRPSKPGTPQGAVPTEADGPVKTSFLFQSAAVPISRENWPGGPGFFQNPGWYDNPDGSPSRRWWDGARWTDKVKSGNVGKQAPGPLSSAQSNRFAVASFLLLVMAIAYEVLVLEEVIGLGPWWLILSIGAIISGAISAVAMFRSPEEGARLGPALASTGLVLGILNIVGFAFLIALGTALNDLWGGG